ncbi:Flp family type IVb pilin [Vibrio intestinalis]|uniref:Flp family type IVb pilin n=1 Tax=Vibrio intestinalis TaxID=2933291 RepID=UPI0021A2F6E4|nr:Flp family type IVb pilin [Vibrio intestinalis]
MILRKYVELQNLAHSFIKEKEGVTAIEYALVGVAIAAIVAAVFGSDTTTGLGLALSNAMANIVSNVQP